MKIHYVVSKAFGKYKRGAIINDPGEIAAVLGSENRHNVVRSIEKPEHASGEFFGRASAPAAPAKPAAKAAAQVAA